MKTLPIMTCLLILGACSGGGGGSHGGMNVRQSNLRISSNIDNETRRGAHVTDTLGAGYYTGGNRDGAARACDGDQRTCNDAAFENMKHWLVENIESIGECEDDAALRNALTVAGFESHIGETIAETKAWIQNNVTRIKNRAQEIYNELGTHRDFDITQSELAVFNGMDFTTNEPSTIVFKVDDNNKITGLTFHDAVGSCGGLDFPGTRQGDTSQFTIGGHAHIYKMEEIAPQYCNYAQYNHYIEIKSSDGLTLDQLKEKLIQYADAELAKGDSGFFGTFDLGVPLQDIYDATIAQINAMDSLDDVSYEHINRRMDFDLKPFGNKVGLAYSDFGRMIIPNPSTPNSHLIYHGGYDDKKVSDAHMHELANDTTTDMNFYGRAVGKVEHKTIPDNEHMVMDAIMMEGNATLNFRGTNDGGIETLRMEFPDWYDVTVTQTADGNSINFANYTNSDEQFKFYIANTGPRDEHTVENFDGVNHFDSDGDSIYGTSTGALQVNYYAHDANSNPAEASGYLSYGESEMDGEVGRVVEFQSAFGTIRDYSSN